MSAGMIDFCLRHSSNITARVCVCLCVRLRTCGGGPHSLMDRRVFNAAGVAGQTAPATHMSDTGGMTGSGLVSEDTASIHNKCKRFMNS